MMKFSKEKQMRSLDVYMCQYGCLSYCSLHHVLSAMPLINVNSVFSWCVLGPGQIIWLGEHLYG